MKERIKALRKTLPGSPTQEEFGASLGVSRDTVSNYELGRVDPPESVLKLICSSYKVNYQWLKDGIGPMYLPPESDIDLILEVMGSENEFAKKVFKSFTKLNDEGWLVIKQLVEDMMQED